MDSCEQWLRILSIGTNPAPAAMLLGVCLRRTELTVQPLVVHWLGLITWIDMIRISASLLVNPRILFWSSSAIVASLLS